MKRILFAALTAAALFSGGILQSLNAQNMEIPKKVSPFPVGDKLPEQFSKYFIGQAWLAPLTVRDLETAKPLVQFKEGQSTTAIYAVRSLGINPMNGKELFYDLNGNLTYDWSAANKVVCGLNF